MLDRSTPAPVTDLTLRTFFGFALVAALFAATNMAVVEVSISAHVRSLLIGAYAAISLGSLLALRLPRETAMKAMIPVVLAGLVVVGSVAMATGWGLRTPGLYFSGVIACMTCAVATLRQGLGITAAASGLVVVLALAERIGVLMPPADAVPLLPRAFVQLGSIGFGAGAGLLLSRLTRAHVREATDREERFRRLLGIAAAAYWETDAELKVRHVSRRNASSVFVALSVGEPRPPWELPEIGMDKPMLALLQERMQARAPLRDVLVRWSPADRPQVLMLVSGEPQFDRRQNFAGYWGVARDVTAEHRARAALLDTEMRYRDLFRRTPSPMVLHREGRVVDANDAAASMLGFDNAHQMLGTDIAVFHGPGGRERLTQRLALLNGLPMGEALPLTDLQLLGVDGRRLSVKATAVRADIGGHSAVLSIYIDETGQRAAALAQQRSEALLRQVVTMSPDAIMLTAMDTQRYEMVNETFTRVTGYTEQEVLGRTSEEIGLWHSQDDRLRLMGALRERGSSVNELAVNFVHRDGRRLPMLISASHFHREGRPYLVINARDMTDATRERLEREAIMDNASVGMAHMRKRRFVMVNPRFEQMYGWLPGELVGQSAEQVWGRPEDVDRLGAEIGDALRKGEQVDIERLARRRDGSTFLARLRAKAVDPQHPSASGTIWIAEDVTAQRQAEAELARARDEAESANRAKSAFLANTSHEIRTPLNGLVGLTRLARDPGVDPARLRQYLDQMADSAETLSMIISDILDLSKVEAGRLEVERAPFSLLALLQSLHHAYTSLADSRDLDFSMDLGQQVPDMVLGDALRVRQILANFLHNALKFTPAGAVRLSVRTAGGDRVRFEVSDTGPGIDPETQARLFMPFTQADESITRRFGGTGLGLSICRELATLMDGQVGLTSDIGQGSCFYVELPLPTVHEDFAKSGQSTQDMMMLSGAHVLLVEDNAVNTMIGMAMLDQWGVSAESAEDGMEGIAAVERSVANGRPFDAVLMDVQMPGMSGHEATRRLRQRWSRDELPIIALTAAALVSEREQALASGMNDFVTKPVEPNRLRQALLRALGKDD